MEGLGMKGPAANQVIPGDVRRGAGEMGRRRWAKGNAPWKVWG
jgi:hypothetical protein